MTAESPTPRQQLIGSGFAMITMVIWAGWNVVSRLGVTQSLTAYDITFLRFATAGLIALPFVWHYRKMIWAAPKWLMLIMVMGAGCVYVLVASKGFTYAPASHGVMIPGTMPLWVALLSWILFKEQFSRIRLIGYGIISLAIIYRVILHVTQRADYLTADLFFIGSGMLWACYTVANKKTALPPLAAMAVVSLGSALLYCIPYAVTHADAIAAYPLGQSLTQMIYQGVLTSLVGLLCYNRAMALIGASRASSFAATIPLLATLMGIPILNEIPTMADWLFVLMLSVGVLCASGVRRITWKR